MCKDFDFSVLLSIYWKEKPEYFSESLSSIINQTIKPSQIVLIVDGQIGNELQEVITAFEDVEYLEVHYLKHNKGLSYALNYGLSFCRYDIVFRMDTDDICYNNRFERVIYEYKNHPEMDIIGSFATMIDENGNKIKLMTAPTKESEIYKKIWTCPFIHPTVSFKKTSIERVGSYNPQSGPRQDDYELWFRCVENGLHCMNIDEPLLYYRFFKDSVSKNNIKVGWWRAKVGLKGAVRCKCSPIAYIGVCYPLVRACMPPFIRELMYKIADKINPRSK